ncbi:MAG: PilZ domain-containing protein [Sandaracinaceae bacterium]|nr:PilZ domain-containing protein [Sandaracinaceae bacterium]
MFELVLPRRRRTLRRGYSIDCQAVRMSGFRLVGGRLLDVSHRGALLECNGALSLGDEVLLSFEAPGRGGAAPYVVDAFTEVRRLARHAGGARAGLVFTEIDWEARAALFVSLVGVPPPIPRQRRVVDYAATVQRIASLA